MKIRLDTASMAPRHVTADAEALASWYDAHPLVRRLWAVKQPALLRVIVSLEPIGDRGDRPAPPLPSCDAWAGELRDATGEPVDLKLLEEPLLQDFDVDFEGEVIAALNWRDPTCFWIAD